MHSNIYILYHSMPIQSINLQENGREFYPNKYVKCLFFYWVRCNRLFIYLNTLRIIVIFIVEFYYNLFVEYDYLHNLYSHKIVRLLFSNEQRLCLITGLSLMEKNTIRIHLCKRHLGIISHII